MRKQKLQHLRKVTETNILWEREAVKASILREAGESKSIKIQVPGANKTGENDH